ncbi:hypothetical protein sos41_04730 [Alphaproteobacteria bacterium SO-S41]|nr:hypothetical protein sos41_04730 [Alphaproteobacteria bacterium SO-S41]
MSFISVIGLWIGAMAAGGAAVAVHETSQTVFWIGFAALAISALSLSWIILGHEEANEALADA